MKTTRIAWLAATLLSASAFAADPAATDPAKAQYDAERARCMSGTTGQDQASCLRSAGAAYESTKQGRLRNPNTDYTDNSLARCKSLPASRPCGLRVARRSAGTSSSDVKGGGSIKETVTTGIPATPTTKYGRATARRQARGSR